MSSQGGRTPAIATRRRWWTERFKRSKRTWRARWPGTAGAGATMWTRWRRPTRRSPWRRRMWRRCRPRAFGFTRTTRRSSSTTRTSRRAVSGGLEKPGAFRAPTNAARSFGELRLHDAPGHGSAESKARLTRPPVPLVVRQLRDFNSGPVAPRLLT